MSAHPSFLRPCPNGCGEQVVLMKNGSLVESDGILLHTYRCKKRHAVPVEELVALAATPTSSPSGARVGHLVGCASWDVRRLCDCGYEGPEPLDAKMEREYDEAQSDPWGWDGYSASDVLAFAALFRRQRDEARRRLSEVEAEREEERRRAEFAYRANADNHKAWQEAESLLQEARNVSNRFCLRAEQAESALSTARLQLQEAKQREASLQDELSTSLMLIGLADNEIAHGRYEGDVARDIRRARGFLANAQRLGHATLASSRSSGVPDA